MSGVNKAIIVGNLGRDPEVRYTRAGTAVTNLSVATNEQWKDRQSGERKTRTEWHRVVLFNRLAEVAAEYLAKGSSVYLEGRIQTEKWEDQAGETRYTTKIIANEMTMLNGGSGGSGASAEPRSASPAAAAPPVTAAGAAPPPAAAPASGGGGDTFDDDIPFAQVPAFP